MVAPELIFDDDDNDKDAGAILRSAGSFDKPLKCASCFVDPKAMVLPGVRGGSAEPLATFDRVVLVLVSLHSTGSSSQSLPSTAVRLLFSLLSSSIGGGQFSSTDDDGDGDDDVDVNVEDTNVLTAARFLPRRLSSSS